MPDPPDLAQADAAASERMRATLACASCGSPDIMAVAPGTEAVHDMFLLVRERPTVCLCRRCLEQRYG